MLLLAWGVEGTSEAGKGKEEDTEFVETKVKAEQQQLKMVNALM